MDVDAQWLVARDEHVDAQVEFVPVNQEWVRNVFGDYAGLINVHVVDVVH